MTHDALELGPAASSDDVPRREAHIDRDSAAPHWTLLTVVTIAAGALVANLYYAQPLISSIGPELHFNAGLAGSIVSVTQIGYGAGLFLIVSLADLFENRRLVLTTITLTAIALVVAATSRTASQFVIASFIIGLCSCGAQVLLPFVAQLVPVETRGRTVGNIMAGLLTGIMLARPVALFVSASWGWRSMFWLSAALMVLIGVSLARLMPRHQPRSGIGAGEILGSMLHLFRDTPALRWRATYQFLMFAAFSAFWTAAPVMLAVRFGMGQRDIGLFALAGAGGALVAPFAGRLADRGFILVMTAGAMVAAGLAFYVTGWAVAATSLAMLVVLTVILDAAVQANQVASQRIIFSVSTAVRGRVNAIYMTIVFLGGALGSVLGTLTYHHGGWNATAALGGWAGIAMLVLLGVEVLGVRRALLREHAE